METSSKLEKCFPLNTVDEIEKIIRFLFGYKITVIYLIEFFSIKGKKT